MARPQTDFHVLIFIAFIVFSIRKNVQGNFFDHYDEDDPQDSDNEQAVRMALTNLGINPDGLKLIRYYTKRMDVKCEYKLRGEICKLAFFMGITGVYITEAPSCRKPKHSPRVCRVKCYDGDEPPQKCSALYIAPKPNAVGAGGSAPIQDQLPETHPRSYEQDDPNSPKNIRLVKDALVKLGFAPEKFKLIQYYKKRSKDSKGDDVMCELKLQGMTCSLIFYNGINGVLTKYLPYCDGPVQVAGTGPRARNLTTKPSTGSQGDPNTPGNVKLVQAALVKLGFNPEGLELIEFNSKRTWYYIGQNIQCTFELHGMICSLHFYTGISGLWTEHAPNCRNGKDFETKHPQKLKSSTIKREIHSKQNKMSSQEAKHEEIDKKQDEERKNITQKPNSSSNKGKSDRERKSKTQKSKSSTKKVETDTQKQRQQENTTEEPEFSTKSGKTNEKQRRKLKNATEKPKPSKIKEITAKLNSKTKNEKLKVCDVTCYEGADPPSKCSSLDKYY